MIWTWSFTRKLFRWARSPNRLLKDRQYVFKKSQPRLSPDMGPRYPLSLHLQITRTKSKKSASHSTQKPNASGKWTNQKNWWSPRPMSQTTATLLTTREMPSWPLPLKKRNMTRGGVLLLLVVGLLWNRVVRWVCWSVLLRLLLLRIQLEMQTGFRKGLLTRKCNFGSQ